MPENTLTALYEIDSGVQELMRRYQLDVQGTKSIDELYKEDKLDLEFFIELVQIFNDTNYFPKEQLKSFPAEIILDYLRKTHIYYLEQRLYEIDQMLNLVLKDRDDQIATVLRKFFYTLKRDLSAHIHLEENLLFPYIEHLHNVAKGQTSDFVPSTNFSIEVFVKTHDDNIENEIRRIREFLVASHKEAADLLPFKVLLRQLLIFEQDLRLHGLIEDDVLIPSAQELEAKL